MDAYRWDDAGSVRRHHFLVDVLHKDKVGAKAGGDPCITLSVYIERSSVYLVVDFAPVVICEPVVGPMRTCQKISQGMEQFEHWRCNDPPSTHPESPVGFGWFLNGEEMGALLR